MRSSGGRVCAGGRRRGGLAASLIVLAACGDNLAPPRLVAARFVYDDGSEQVDHRQLFDRVLAALCTPTPFSDGATYCTPPTDIASYADDKCIHPLGRVPTGQSPKPYFATSYTLNNQQSPSHLYRLGALGTAPLVRYERQENLCVAYPLDDGFDYYELGAEVTDLPRVHLASGDVVGSWQLNNLVGEDLMMPWGLLDNEYGECDVLARPNHTITYCHPTASTEIAYYSDTQCTMPIITAPSRPPLAYSGAEGCRAYFEPGLDLLSPTVYQRIGQACVQSSLLGAPKQFTVGASVTLRPLKREHDGPRRLDPVVLAPTPLLDEIMFDTALGQSCARDANDRCVPVGAAAVESWFADDLCGQPIDVAIVDGFCAGPTKFARKGDTFYPVLDVYTPQLYQLEPGDRCGTYKPPVPFVAHSIGPALGEGAFARATLMVE